MENKKTKFSFLRLNAVEPHGFIPVALWGGILPVPRSGTGCRVKVISALMAAFFFIFSTGINYAATTGAGSGDISEEDLGLSKKSEITDPNIIKIPPQYGRITETYDSNTAIQSSGKLIIHIQDAHCHYEGQKSLAGMLEALIKQYGLKLIFVEGGNGDVSLSYLRSYATKEKRLEIAERYLKEGKIAGEEYLNIVSDYPMELWGIEDPEAYQENLNLFLEIDTFRDNALTILNSFNESAEALKPIIFNAKLRELEDKKAKNRKGELPITDYYKYLAQTARANSIELNAYPNFERFIMVRELEPKIKFEEVDLERTKLIEELSHALPKPELAALVARSLDYKMNRMSAQKYHEFLKSATEENSFDIKAFPNLNMYMQYLEYFGSLNNDLLFKEKDAVEKDIKTKLFTNATEIKLSEISETLGILSDFMNLGLSPEEFKVYEDNPSRFAGSYWHGFLKEAVRKYKVSKIVPEDTSIIDENLPKLHKFYELTRKRDTAFIQKATAKMEAEGVTIAALIAGGFHTPHLTQMFKQTNLSYLVVAPKVTEAQDVNIYRSVLRYKAKTNLRAEAARNNRRTITDINNEVGIPENISIRIAAGAVPEDILRTTQTTAVPGTSVNISFAVANLIADTKIGDAEAIEASLANLRGKTGLIEAVAELTPADLKGLTVEQLDAIFDRLIGLFPEDVRLERELDLIPIKTNLRRALFLAAASPTTPILKEDDQVGEARKGGAIGLVEFVGEPKLVQKPDGTTVVQVEVRRIGAPEAETEVVEIGTKRVSAPYTKKNREDLKSRLNGMLKANQLLTPEQRQKIQNAINSIVDSFAGQVVVLESGNKLGINGVGGKGFIGISEGLISDSDPEALAGGLLHEIGESVLAEHPEFAAQIEREIQGGILSANKEQYERHINKGGREGIKNHYLLRTLTSVGLGEADTRLTATIKAEAAVQGIIAAIKGIKELEDAEALDKQIEKLVNAREKGEVLRALTILGALASRISSAIEEAESAENTKDKPALRAKNLVSLTNALYRVSTALEDLINNISTDDIGAGEIIPGLSAIFPEGFSAENNSDVASGIRKFFLARLNATMEKVEGLKPQQDGIEKAMRRWSGLQQDRYFRALQAAEQNGAGYFTRLMPKEADIDILLDVLGAIREDASLEPGERLTAFNVARVADQLVYDRASEAGMGEVVGVVGGGRGKGGFKGTKGGLIGTWELIKSEIIRDANGKIIGIKVTAKDINKPNPMEETTIIDASEETLDKGDLISRFNDMLDNNPALTDAQREQLRGIIRPIIENSKGDFLRLGQNKFGIMGIGESGFIGLSDAESLSNPNVRAMGIFHEMFEAALADNPGLKGVIEGALSEDAKAFRDAKTAKRGETTNPNHYLAGALQMTISPAVNTALTGGIHGAIKQQQVVAEEAAEAKRVELETKMRQAYRNGAVLPSGASVSVGMTTEAVRAGMRAGVPAPDVVVLPGEFFQNGQNFMDILEFVGFHNWFNFGGKGFFRKTVLIVPDSQRKKALEKVLNMLIFGQEGWAFRNDWPVANVKQLSDMFDIRVAGEGDLQVGVKGNTYTLTEKGQPPVTAEADFTKPERAAEDVLPEEVRGQLNDFIVSDFAVLPLGTSDGFDAKEGTDFSQLMIRVNGQTILVDPSAERLAALEKMGIKPDVIYLTHAHNDHVGGTLAKIMEAKEKGGKVKIIAAPQVKEDLLTYAGALISPADIEDGRKKAESLLDYTEIRPDMPVEFAGAKLEVHDAAHTVPVFGLKVTYKGKKFAYSADTAYYPALLNWLSDADFVIHEAGIAPIHSAQDQLLELPEVAGQVKDAERQKAYGKLTGEARQRLASLVANKKFVLVHTANAKVAEHKELSGSERQEVIGTLNEVAMLVEADFSKAREAKDENKEKQFDAERSRVKGLIEKLKNMTGNMGLYFVSDTPGGSIPKTAKDLRAKLPAGLFVADAASGKAAQLAKAGGLIAPEAPAPIMVARAESDNAAQRQVEELLADIQDFFSRVESDEPVTVGSDLHTTAVGLVTKFDELNGDEKTKRVLQDILGAKGSSLEALETEHVGRIRNLVNTVRAEAPVATASASAPAAPAGPVAPTPPPAPAGPATPATPATPVAPVLVAVAPAIEITPTEETRLAEAPVTGVAAPTKAEPAVATVPISTVPLQQEVKSDRVKERYAVKPLAAPQAFNMSPEGIASRQERASSGDGIDWTLAVSDTSPEALDRMSAELQQRYSNHLIGAFLNGNEARKKNIIDFVKGKYSGEFKDRYDEMAVNLLGRLNPGVKASIIQNIRKSAPGYQFNGNGNLWDIINGLNQELKAPLMEKLLAAVLSRNFIEAQIKKVSPEAKFDSTTPIMRQLFELMRNSKELEVLYNNIQRFRSGVGKPVSEQEVWEELARGEIARLFAGTTARMAYNTSYAGKYFLNFTSNEIDMGKGYKISGSEGNLPLRNGAGAYFTSAEAEPEPFLFSRNNGVIGRVNDRPILTLNVDTKFNADSELAQFLMKNGADNGFNQMPGGYFYLNDSEDWLTSRNNVEGLFAGINGLNIHTIESGKGYSKIDDTKGKPLGAFRMTAENGFSYFGGHPDLFVVMPTRSQTHESEFFEYVGTLERKVPAEVEVASASDAAVLAAAPEGVETAPEAVETEAGRIAIPAELSSDKFAAPFAGVVNAAKDAIGALGEKASDVLKPNETKVDIIDLDTLFDKSGKPRGLGFDKGVEALKKALGKENIGKVRLVVANTKVRQDPNTGEPLQEKAVRDALLINETDWGKGKLVYFMDLSYNPVEGVIRAIALEFDVSDLSNVAAAFLAENAEAFTVGDARFSAKVEGAKLIKVDAKEGEIISPLGVLMATLRATLGDLMSTQEFRTALLNAGVKENELDDLIKSDDKAYVFKVKSQPQGELNEDYLKALEEAVKLVGGAA